MLTEYFVNACYHLNVTLSNTALSKHSWNNCSFQAATKQNANISKEGIPFYIFSISTVYHGVALNLLAKTFNHS